eukprot:1751793-Rhodomonas_salina.2
MGQHYGFSTQFGRGVQPCMEAVADMKGGGRAGSGAADASRNRRAPPPQVNTPSHHARIAAVYGRAAAIFGDVPAGTARAGRRLPVPPHETPPPPAPGHARSSLLNSIQLNSTQLTSRILN